MRGQCEQHKVQSSYSQEQMRSRPADETSGGKKQVSATSFTKTAVHTETTTKMAWETKL
jgi:hypothetical protein